MDVEDGKPGFYRSQRWLEEVVHFYNTRDVESSWPPPEVDENVNDGELGNLGLSFNVGGFCKVYDGLDNIVAAPAPPFTAPCEEELIVTFMETLSDGYVLKKNK